ncbi:MAG: Ig-like domain-containing protein [Eubacterium ventriosum]
MVIAHIYLQSGNIVNAETVKIDTNRFKTVVIEKGKSAKLCNLSMKKIKWKSTNKKVATVNKKGLVKAKKIGKAKITLKDQYGKRKTINVQVKKKLKKATNKNVTVKVVEGNKDYVKLELNNKSDQCIFVAYPYYLIVKNGEKEEYVSKKKFLILGDHR